MKFSKYLRLLFDKGLSAAAQREDLIKRCKVKYPGGQSPRYGCGPTQPLLKSKKYRLNSGVIAKVEFRRKNAYWRPYNSRNGFYFQRYIEIGNKRYIIETREPGKIISWTVNEEGKWEKINSKNI